MSAKQVIQDVCMRYGVSADDFFDPRQRMGAISAARSQAIVRLREKFSLKQVARMLRVHPSTISYHVYANRRAMVKAAAMKRYQQGS